ncbi:hypothetical protein [Microvirga tunisiensis]|uniref:Uncharacterized protein n=1 Tax=Microvirga tunisiensis TaxID=2108360 RepID=A0A5N7MA90_9HYPH|nr:hypothetical protein [Microvirga tunisiensis]MPR05623.1 hypothetical protein [Microvirga tunisiensis]MPR23823.1 hypothetical protein [Microvirga tunisiensis]
MLHTPQVMHELGDRFVALCRELAAHYKSPHDFPMTATSLVRGREPSVARSIGIVNPMNLDGKISDPILVLSQMSQCSPLQPVSPLDNVVEQNLKNGARRGLNRRRTAEIHARMREEGHTQIPMSGRGFEGGGSAGGPG